MDWGQSVRADYRGSVFPLVSAEAHKSAAHYGAEAVGSHRTGVCFSLHPRMALRSVPRDMMWTEIPINRISPPEQSNCLSQVLKLFHSFSNQAALMPKRALLLSDGMILPSVIQHSAQKGMAV